MAWAAANNDAFVPELWVKEGLALLTENMVIGNLVHRDFQNEIKGFGDVVNTRKPSAFTFHRKTDSVAVTNQDAVSTNVPVALNQWGHVSFMIYDGEQSTSFTDLVNIYLTPAMNALATGIDKTLLGQQHAFRANNAGRLGLLGSTTAWPYMLEADKVMNDNNVPVIGRNLIISTAAKKSILESTTFHEAQKVGDQGSALRNASIGRAAGFDIFMCQNTPSYTYTDTVADAVNLVGGYAAGSTVILVDDITGIVVGSYVKIVGDGTPQLVTAVGASTTNEMTIAPGLYHAVANDAVITSYSPGLLDESATAAAGMTTEVTIDNLDSTKDIQVGQCVSFGTASVVADADAHYTMIQVTDSTGNTFEVLLDRPVDAALVNNAIACMYPSGDYNLAFHRNAIALVTRPLALPRAGTGVLAAAGEHKGISLRICMTYDGSAQGTRVTCDLLYGVKVLDASLGCVMYG